MRFLVIGCRSIGMRHIDNLRRLGVDGLTVFDISEERRNRAHQKYEVHPFDSLEEALESGTDVAIVATPTHLHIPMALQAARAGCHLFIEKPLSHTDQGIDELVEIVKRNHLVTMVACNIRFHYGPLTIKRLLEKRAIGKVISASIEFGQYLPDWVPSQNYRQRYSAHTSMGGGIVLDSIHEIDYARWLFGEVNEVFCYGGKLSNLDIDSEDSANILMKFDAGFSAMIHLDYIQRDYARSCKIIGDEGTILWDFTTPLRWFSTHTKKWNIVESPEGYGINNMYLEEMQHYLNCLDQNKKPAFDVEQATQVTRLALAIKQSMSTGTKVTL